MTGLFGALSSHRFKWGFFGAGCMFQVLLFVGMLFPGEWQTPPGRAVLLLPSTPDSSLMILPACTLCCYYEVGCHFASGCLTACADHTSVLPDDMTHRGPHT